MNKEHRIHIIMINNHIYMKTIDVTPKSNSLDCTDSNNYTWYEKISNDTTRND